MRCCHSRRKEAGILEKEYYESDNEQKGQITPFESEMAQGMLCVAHSVKKTHPSEKIRPCGLETHVDLSVLAIPAGTRGTIGVLCIRWTLHLPLILLDHFRHVNTSLHVESVSSRRAETSPFLSGFIPSMMRVCLDEMSLGSKVSF